MGFMASGALRETAEDGLAKSFSFGLLAGQHGEHGMVENVVSAAHAESERGGLPLPFYRRKPALPVVPNANRSAIGSRGHDANISTASVGESVFNSAMKLPARLWR